MKLNSQGFSYSSGRDPGTSIAIFPNQARGSRNSHGRQLFEGKFNTSGRLFLGVVEQAEAIYETCPEGVIGETNILSLRISDCKKHCSMYYSNYSIFLKLPCKLSKYHINKLLKWSLDYSYIEFGNKYFYQHKGIQIQMRNCASVVIFILQA